MKKYLALLLALAMVFALAACGGNTPADTADEPAVDEPVADAPAQTFKVGVCQLVPHVALDAATQGFMDVLTDEFGDNVSIDNQNAAGESATCGTIINGFVSNNVDLIMANATPALQAAASATDTIPVLGTSITEYGVALGIEGFTGTVGTNVSGTSDLAPLDEQAAMIKEWMPDATTVGLVYCSAEANSQYQVDNVQAALETLGYTCTQYAFSDTSDMASVVQNAADSSDVLYVPTDNTCASNTGVIDNICHGKVPVFVGEEGICEGCGVATLSISYYDLGVATGKMAVRILKGESNVSEMPIEYAPQFVKKYNPNVCEALGLTPPSADYEAIG